MDGTKFKKVFSCHFTADRFDWNVYTFSCLVVSHTSWERGSSLIHSNPQNTVTMEHFLFWQPACDMSLNPDKVEDFWNWAKHILYTCTMSICIHKASQLAPSWDDWLQNAARLVCLSLNPQELPTRQSWGSAGSTGTAARLKEEMKSSYCVTRSRKVPGHSATSPLPLRNWFSMTACCSTLTCWFLCSHHLRVLQMTLRWDSSPPTVGRPKAPSLRLTSIAKLPLCSRRHPIMTQTSWSQSPSTCSCADLQTRKSVNQWISDTFLMTKVGRSRSVTESEPVF